jgi:3-oxoacyl-[acyl-carrier protein] reductase
MDNHTEYGHRGRPLSGRVAIVTGASRGIGWGIAQRLAAAGAIVVAAARTLEDSDDRGSAVATARLIEQRGGRALAVELELERADSRESLIASAMERFGRIDILVNNGGTAAYLPTDKMPLASAVAQIDAYLLGPWHLCHLVLPHMKRQGRGWVLNVGSCAVAAPEPPYAAYNAARGNETLYAALKAAIHRLSTGLAAEIFADGISVNVVAPVLAVYTPGLASLNLGISPDSPICEPIEDIAEAAVAILESEPSKFTGRVEYSYQYLERLGRSTRSLDGRQVVKTRALKRSDHG